MLLFPKVNAGRVMNKQTTKRREQRTGKKDPGQRHTANIIAICVFLMAVFLSGNVFAQGELREKVPDVCYKCHVKLREKLSGSQVHFPFRDGRCLSCHNAHAGNMKGLVREDINTLCLGCHDAVRRNLDQGYVHRALKKGVCTDCHHAHSGEYTHLLVKTQKDLCWNCHSSIQDQAKKKFTHKPFREGECSSCHNAHASSQENLMRDTAQKLCRKCHSAGCRVGGVSIASAVDKSDCTSCHSGHASDSSGHLGPYGHSAFLEKQCNTCHDPIVTDRKITTRISGSALCLSCHKKDALRVRENDMHIRDENGGCALCHNYHASKRQNLTGKESQICMTCHKDTGKRTEMMEKALRSIKCIPVKDRKCFECHNPPHSPHEIYLRADGIQTCARCHIQQHKVAHPLGRDVKDPRSGQPVSCITCHSMHSSKAEFMLYFDRKRQLCIQCHKR